MAKKKNYKVTQLTWKLFYLGGHRAIGRVKLYDRVIDTAVKIVGVEKGAMSSKAYIALHYEKLAAHTSAHSKEITKARTARKDQQHQRKIVNSAVDNVQVTSDAFLSTYEWRRVRMVALKKYGARCQCCGASPADGAVMNVDHIKPRKLFPHLALDVDNLQILCHDCNHGKGNWDMTDWRPAEVDSEAISHLKSILDHG